jgi:acyl transferase domain-containing protein
LANIKKLTLAQAGDGVESSSLESVFGGLSNSQSIYLTSIKGSIGHAEAASGAASLAKILMMMRHSTIPPQVGFKRLNPKMENLLSGNFDITTQSLEWKTPNNSPKRALLNNFGAAGSNVALIVEEHQRKCVPPKTERPTRAAYNFILSAKSEAALKDLARLHLEKLQKNRADPAIEDICYTVTARRQMYNWRASVVAKTVPELAEQLGKDLIIHHCGQRTGNPIVFIFSGQGSFYSGMGKQLLSTAPVFRRKYMNVTGYCGRLVFLV